jgi:hypothetical protein
MEIIQRRFHNGKMIQPILTGFAVKMVTELGRFWTAYCTVPTSLAGQ